MVCTSRRLCVEVVGRQCNRLNIYYRCETACNSNKTTFMSTSEDATRAVTLFKQI